MGATTHHHPQKKKIRMTIYDDEIDGNKNEIIFNLFQQDIHLKQ